MIFAMIVLTMSLFGAAFVLDDRRRPGAAAVAALLACCVVAWTALVVIPARVRAPDPAPIPSHAPAPSALPSHGPDCIFLRWLDDKWTCEPADQAG